MSRVSRLISPGRADLLAVQLPSWAWHAYWVVHPVRLVADRLRRRHGGGDLGVFLGTPAAMIAPVLALAEPVEGELVVDLGCGDGRVLIEAAAVYGCRGRGIERDPDLVVTARENVAAAGLTDRIEIVQGDAGKADLSDAQVVFAFLPSETVARLLSAILREIGSAGRFVTHEQVGVSWPVAPDHSQLIVSGGVTVAHVWRQSV